jgi:hypothetical protein
LVSSTATGGEGRRLADASEQLARPNFAISALALAAIGMAVYRAQRAKRAETGTIDSNDNAALTV